MPTEASQVSALPVELSVQPLIVHLFLNQRWLMSLPVPAAWRRVIGSSSGKTMLTALINCLQGRKSSWQAFRTKRLTHILAGTVDVLCFISSLSELYYAPILSQMKVHQRFSLWWTWKAHPSSLYSSGGDGRRIPAKESGWPQKEQQRWQEKALKIESPWLGDVNNPALQEMLLFSSSSLKI